MGKIYLYLLKRNKKDVKIIGTMKCDGNLHPSRLNDVGLLQLDSKTYNSIKEIVEKHKMEWEIWIESADNYNDLKNKLIERKIISSSNNFLLNLDNYEIPKSMIVQLNKNKIMARRFS